MKKITSLIFALFAAVSFGSVKQIDLDNGTNTLTSAVLPYGNAQVLSFETYMLSGGGSVSLSLGKTVSGEIVHTDITTDATTNVTETADTWRNNYYITSIYQSGTTNATYNVIYKNKYQSTTTATNFAEYGTFRTTFTPGNGQKTTVYPTNYMVKAEAFGHNFYTNFVWAPEQAQITLYRATPAETNIFHIVRDMPATMVYIPVTNITTTVTTNIWSEQATKVVTIPLVPSTTLTNSANVTRFTEPINIFEGDSLICTSPVTTNNPGQVQIVIRDEALGTLRPIR